MESGTRGFFDGNPKMLFVFGLVSGIALALLLTSTGVLGASSDNLLGATNDNSGTTQPVAAAKTGGTGAAPAPVPSGEVAEVTDADHYRGNKNAEVTLVEYSDYECPFCKRFHPTLLQMMDEYEGKVKWVYRHFPLSFHANAQKEAEAAECANELGGNDKFWEYSDAIFERTTAGGTGFALDALVPLAKELGLNEKKFQECLDSGKYASHINADMAGGSEAGISGTPGSIIIDKNGNSQLLSGAVPFTSIKSVIDQMLAQ